MPVITAQTMRRIFLLPGLLFCLLYFSGCATQVSTAEIRHDIATGNYSTLGKALEESFEDRPVMMNALNMGSFQQFQQRWDESIQYFDIAAAMLDEYEQRAIVSVRKVGGNVGSYTLSRGLADNFGNGYERSLLHTFNGLNYMMKADFQAAAVEMRRMEMRQELWLEETGHRIQKGVEKEKKRQEKEQGDEAGIPPGYSMREILESPELRKLASSYQDPFSYSLSAIVCRIAGDNEYAGVSLSRACQLDDNAYNMFSGAWRSPQAGANGKRWSPRVPPLPPRYSEGAANNPPTQELVLIFTGGLVPALKMEQIRIQYSDIGYILIDLPSYEPSIAPVAPQIALSAGNVTAYPLLRTDLLAYKHLQDEMPYELTASIGRALTRLAISTTGEAVASSSEDTEDYAPLVGFLLTVGMDAFASSGNKNVRNWELLPARGYLGMADIPRGSTLTLTFDGKEHKVEIPTEARGIIVLASQMEKSNLRVNYVTY